MNGVRAMFAAAFLAASTGLVPATAAAQGVQLFAVLLGGNEVSTTGGAGAGDPNGNGTASVLFVGRSQLCFTIAVTKIGTPSAAHIHEGKAGTNGLIKVNLLPPTPGNPGTSSGCVSDLDPALLSKIKASPSLFYVNVHNGDFPGGALRGQLF